MLLFILTPVCIIHVSIYLNRSFQFQVYQKLPQNYKSILQNSEELAKEGQFVYKVSRVLGQGITATSFCAEGFVFTVIQGGERKD